MSERGRGRGSLWSAASLKLEMSVGVGGGLGCRLACGVHLWSVASVKAMKVEMSRVEGEG